MKHWDSLAGLKEEMKALCHLVQQCSTCVWTSYILPVLCTTSRPVYAYMMTGMYQNYIYSYWYMYRDCTTGEDRHSGRSRRCLHTLMDTKSRTHSRLTHFSSPHPTGKEKWDKSSVCHALCVQQHMWQTRWTVSKSESLCCWFFSFVGMYHHPIVSLAFINFSVLCLIIMVLSQWQIQDMRKGAWFRHRHTKHKWKLLWPCPLSTKGPPPTFTWNCHWCTCNAPSARAALL